MRSQTILLGAVFLTASSFALAADATVPKDAAVADAAAVAAATPTSPWKKQVVAKYTLNQAHFDNWSQGGTDTIAWQAGLFTTFERVGTKGDWKNTLTMQYGRSKSDGAESLKSSDELFLESVYSLNAMKWINPFVAGMARTQMDKGYATVLGSRIQTSQFMDPGYFTESAGMAYDGKKGFTSRLGFAVKESIANRFTAFTDDPLTTTVEKSRTEPGLNSVSEFKTKLSAQTLFSTKLDVFSNMKKSKDLYSRWSSMLTVKAAKFLDVNAEFELLYDGHVSIRRQISQGLGLGLSYSLL